MAQMTPKIICAGKIYLEDNEKPVPRLFRSVAYEIEEPYRTAKVLVIRGHKCAWCKRAVAFQVGFWGKKRTLEDPVVQEHLMEAVGGETFDKAQIKDWIRPDYGTDDV